MAKSEGYRRQGLIAEVISMVSYCLQPVLMGSWPRYEGTGWGDSGGPEQSQRVNAVALGE
jgi:hypothetical protein